MASQQFTVTTSSLKAKVRLCKHLCTALDAAFQQSQHNPSHWHTLTVPRFTSGSILSRNWDSVLWGDRKSANSWLLLSSGCCRSFWGGKINMQFSFFPFPGCHFSMCWLERADLEVSQLPFIYSLALNNHMMDHTLKYLKVLLGFLWCNFEPFQIIREHKGHESSLAITDFMETILLSSENRCATSSDPYLKILLELLALRCQELVILGADDSFRWQLRIWKGACRGWWHFQRRKKKKMVRKITHRAPSLLLLQLP